VVILHLELEDQEEVEVVEHQEAKLIQMEQQELLIQEEVEVGVLLMVLLLEEEHQAVQEL
jgi:hypothetical protein